MISSVIPMAVIIVIDIWLSRTKMFRSEAKTGDSRESATQSTTRISRRMPSCVRKSQCDRAGQRADDGLPLRLACLLRLSGALSAPIRRRLPSTRNPRTPLLSGETEP